MKIPNNICLFASSWRCSNSADNMDCKHQRRGQDSPNVLTDFINFLLWLNSLRFDIYRNLEGGCMKLYTEILKCDHFIDKVSVFL